MLRLLLAALVAATFAITTAAAEPSKGAAADKKPAAEDKKPGSDEKKSKADDKEPALSVTEHEVTIDGKLIRYRATAGFQQLKDAKGEKVRANLFFVAYAKIGDHAAGDRPVTFSFNGGPGSSSVWLHLGALGPKRVLMSDLGESLPPPYRWADNPWSWLDRTDLVFIDPVSTGYSRAAEGVEAKDFHGFTADIEAVGDFIRLWTTRNQRWASPKFLVGESYGTTRAAGLSEYLQSRYNYYLNGIMLVSSILNFQTARFAPANDLPPILFLPTYTATAWYHGRLGPDLQSQPLAAVLAQAEAFALGEYATALMQGDALPAAARQRIAAEVARFTGLPAGYVSQQNLRIEIQKFTRMLLLDDNRSVGRLDSRLKGIRYNPGTDDPDFDPAIEAIYGGYTTAINDYLRRDLRFESDLPYEILTGAVQPWSYRNVENTYLNVAEDLRRAISRNPHLRVWISSGRYDLATPYFATDYTVSHMALDPAVRGNLTTTYYDSGHMMYIHLESLKKFKADYAAWMTDVLAKAGR